RGPLCQRSFPTRRSSDLRSGEAARLAKTTVGQGAAVFGDSRPDARDRATDAGGQGTRVGCRCGENWQAIGRAERGGNRASGGQLDRKSTRLNSSHVAISY